MKILNLYAGIGGNRNHRGGTIKTLEERKMLYISKYNIKEKRKILRNCVEPETGLHIFKESFKIQRCLL